jgi:hypothetical protein
MNAIYAIFQHKKIVCAHTHIPMHMYYEACSNETHLAIVLGKGTEAIRNSYNEC